MSDPLMSIPENLRDIIGDADWFDASRIDLFHTCPRRYYYRHELHLVPADGGSNNDALTFGSAIHAALELHYKGVGWLMVPCPHRNPMDGECPFCRDGMTRNLFARFLEKFPSNLETERRMQITGLRLLAKYLEHYRSEPFEVHAIEQPIIFPIDDFYFVGKIDLLITWPDWHITDHKTAGRVSDNYHRGFRIHTQITGYMLAASAAIGEPVSKAVVNTLVVPAGAKPVEPEKHFVRRITTRNQGDFDEWYMTIRSAVADVRRARQTDTWPQRSSGCFSYNRQCEYWDLCTVAQGARMGIINAQYKVDPWDPTNIKEPT
jgi:hypothetical protein